MCSYGPQKASKQLNREASGQDFAYVNRAVR